MKNEYGLSKIQNKRVCRTLISHNPAPFRGLFADENFRQDWSPHAESGWVVLQKILSQMVSL